MAVLKKIYFPSNTYSINKDAIKEIINGHGLTWIKSAMRYYGEKMAGIYANADGTKRVMVIYGGSKKPATFIVKSSSGGKFLLDLLGYSATIGAEIFDVDERYVEKVKVALNTGGDISVADRKRYSELSINDKKELDIKINKVVDVEWKKYVKNVDNNIKDNSVMLGVVEYFRRRIIKTNIVGMLDHGLDHLVFAR